MKVLSSFALAASFLFIAAVFTSCSSTYMKRADAAHSALYRGEYERAAKLIGEVKPTQKDELLYLMDKGVILSAAGKYEESNKALAEAEELADRLSSKSVSREIGATVGSEEATEYSGDRHEIVMIPVVRMLNYLMMDDWDGALVEVRRVENIVGREYGSSAEFDNAFAIYLSAVIWEAVGQINDALIDYKRLASLKKEVPYYAEDLKYTSKKLGLAAKLPDKSSSGFETSDNYRAEGMGQLIVIAQTGRSPKFVSEYVSDGMISMAIPVAFVWPDPPARADVIVDGKKVGQTYPFYNIADDVIAAMKTRQKRTLIRKVIKTSVQAGLYGASYELMQSDDTADQGIGVALGLMGIFMAAAEKADERSWRTLSSHYEIGRFFLPPGKRDVEIVSSGGSGRITKSVEIDRDKPEVIFVYLPAEGYGESRRYAAKSSAKKKISDHEKRLLKEAKRNPSNGNLKLELAEARMTDGDYDVKNIVVDGIQNGGNEKTGYSLLMISGAVVGEYPLAAKSAKLAGFDYYSDALGYVAGDKKSAPSKKRVLDLEPGSGMQNGFGYFVDALVAQKGGKNEDACRLFLKSYEHGLRGEAVVKRILGAFSASGDDFKKSKEGTAIVDKFAEEYISSF